MSKLTQKDKSKPHKSTTRLQPTQSQNITKDKLKNLLPKNTSVSITDEVLQLIQNMGTDIDFPQEGLEEDLMSYMHLLHQGSNSVESLVNAIKYCNLKRNYQNKKAWSIVFPERYDNVIAKGGHVDNHVASFNRSKLVLAIDKEMLIPVHLQYSPYFNKGVQELYKVGVLNDAGLNADGDKMTVSPMVKVQALKELVAITKAPEESKIDIAIGMDEKTKSVQEHLANQLDKMLDLQMADLKSGRSIEDVQVLGLNADPIIEVDEDEC